ncbi:hypothetical protein [Paenibacillus pinihumi]|uniref:hypothetical protein n=1 Tax=Paenibacillus pinihumi TaxID=669462 RepID=UPI00049153ED|nr:hypothetical protein [Paenibacillus pinihumi]
MNFIIGTAESSDMKIIYDDTNVANIKIINLVPEIPDNLVNDKIKYYLIKYGLSNLSLIIYYYGANEWVIESRIEALSNSFH